MKQKLTTYVQKRQTERSLSQTSTKPIIVEINSTKDITVDKIVYIITLYYIQLYNYH